MYEAFRRSLDDLHRVHADPNPGNYLFQSDGSVGLIDFGCVKTVTPRFAELVTATTSCYLEERHAEAFQLMREMGFYGELGDREARELDRNLVRPFAELLVTPMRESRFDFGKNRGYAAACGQRFMEIVRKSTTSGIYPDLLFVNRTQYGLYRLFELIGARVELEHAA
jgi:Ser/Thr protein kinase RdoA (MazF antagonist)